MLAQEVSPGNKTGLIVSCKGRRSSYDTDSGGTALLPPEAHSQSICSTESRVPTYAIFASPMNRPCATTPGMSLSARANAAGSSIFPKLQSRI